jgi:hypothetical protein
MASNTHYTRIVVLLKGIPWMYPLLRNAFRFLKRIYSTLLHGVIPPCLGFGPARGFYSGYDLVRCEKAFGEILFDRQKCPLFPENSLVRRSGLGQDGHQPWPLFWMEIPQARLCGRSLVPWNPDGHLLAEATFSQKGDSTDPACNHLTLRSGALITGNATSIVSRWGGDAWGNHRYGGAGYWHWLFDSVSRLSLMDRFPEDTKVITPPLTPWMRWFLERLGLENRIIETKATSLRVEHFYFSSPSSMTGCWNPYAVEFLRRSFLPHASPPSSSLTKRFYIIREGYTRGIANEQKVRDYFKSQGWALIAPEKLSIPDQIALFRDAEAVAGLHGSALTNLVWCSPRTTVIEFNPDNFMSGAFEWLSTLNKLSHHFILCSINRGAHSQVPMGELYSIVKNI